MAKKNVLKKYDELLENHEFCDHDIPDDMAIAEMMSGFIGASNHHLGMALELTKIAVSKTSENMKVEDVFSAFENAMKIISENTPLKELANQFTQLSQDKD